MSEEREEREKHWTEQIIALLQERNTQGLEELGILRDIAADVKTIVAALPQSSGQLKQ
jgi:hypothetical protein